MRALRRAGPGPTRRPARPARPDAPADPAARPPARARRVTGSGDAAEAAQEFVVVGKDALPVKMTLGNNDTEVTGKVAVVSFAASPAQGSDVYVSITATDENGDEVNLDILEDINVGKAGGSVAVRLSSFIADGTNVTVEAA